MPPLQVRDLPQDVYDDLKEIARRKRRSLAQQAAYILEAYVENWREVQRESPRERLNRLEAYLAYHPEAREARAQSLRDRFGDPVGIRLRHAEEYVDAAELIREGRDEKDRQISEALGLGEREDADR